MPRIRTIKPEAWADRKIGSLSIEAQHLFVVLITFSDDYGVFSADPGAIWAHGYRFKPEWMQEVPVRLDELEKADRIARYVDGDEQYGWIPTWSKHQKVDHPSRRRQSVPPREIVARFSADSRETVAKDSRDPRESTETPVNTDARESVERDSRESRNGTLDHGPRTEDQGPGKAAARESDPEFAVEVDNWLDRLFADAREHRLRWSSNVLQLSEYRARMTALLTNTADAAVARRVMRDFADALAGGRITQNPPEALRGFLNRAETTDPGLFGSTTGRTGPQDDALDRKYGGLG